MKKLTRILIGLSVLAVLMVCMTAVSFAGTADDKATVNFKAGEPGSFDYINENLEVTGDMFEKAFPELAGEDKVDGVSLADAIVAAHIAKYGSENAATYMGFSATAYGLSVAKQFGHDNVGFYYANNNSTDGAGIQEVVNGDVIFVGSYVTDGWADLFSEFDADTIEAPVNTEVELGLTCNNWGVSVVPQTAELKVVDPATGAMTDVDGATYENGTFKFSFAAKGVYYLSATGSVTYEGFAGETTGKFAGAWVKVIVAPTDKATVNFKAGTSGSFDYINEKLNVTGNDFEEMFPDMAANDADGITFADALAAAHAAKYGKDASSYIGFAGKDWMNKQFGHDIVGFYYLNDKSTPEGVNSTVIKSGDKLFAGAYASYDYAEVYSMFDKASYTAYVGKTLTVTLKCGNSMGSDYEQLLTPTGVALMKVTPSTGKMTKISGAAYKNGKITVKFTKKGTYYISATGSVTYDNGWSGEVTGGIAGAYAKVVVKDVTPAKPVIKSAKRKAKKVAVVTWKKAKDAKKYQVAYKKAGSKKWTIKKTTKTKITLKKLNAKKKYQVKVLAINGSAKSKYSKVKTIKIKK